MSGGHFDYKDNRICDFIERIEDDIRLDDINDSPFKDEIIRVAKLLIRDLHKVKDVLHSYDWFMSGDTGEEYFLNEAHKYYKPKKEKRDEMALHGE